MQPKELIAGLGKIWEALVWLALWALVGISRTFQAQPAGPLDVFFVLLAVGAYAFFEYRYATYLTELRRRNKSVGTVRRELIFGALILLAVIAVAVLRHGWSPDPAAMLTSLATG